MPGPPRTGQLTQETLCRLAISYILQHQAVHIHASVLLSVLLMVSNQNAGQVLESERDGEMFEIHD